MDLSTTYLGLALPHPFIVGASYLTDDVDRVRRLEEAGAAAVVLPSLFEEQVSAESRATIQALEKFTESFGEAQSFLPAPDSMRLGADYYLEHIRRVKAAVKIPVIASLNGVSLSGWLDHARAIEQAGADALELNVYQVAADPTRDSAAVDGRVVALAQRVKASLSIPVAVKLSPYHSALASLAEQLDAVGTDGLVLFNRFFQPDIDTETCDIKPVLRLSDSNELGLRLAWLGLFSGRVKASLAVTGGVHTAEDAAKAVLCGADAIQVVSCLLLQGMDHLRKLRDDLAYWLEIREYESLAQAKGSLNLSRCPDPSAYQRANYMKMVQGWRP